jgi:hypothetical protein
MKKEKYSKKKEDKNTEDYEKQCLGLVNNRFKSAKNFREQEQEPVWERSYNNWRGVLDSSIYPWRSKLFIPWTFTVIETIIPKVFARDPKWRAVSRGEPTPVEPQAPVVQGGYEISTPEQATVINKLLTYQWERMGMRTKMYDYIKDSLMYSKGFAKVTWNFKTKTTTIEEPVVGKDDEITYKTVKKSEVANDEPQVDIVDPFDIYVDPDATSLNDAMYVIHRKTVPLEEVKQNTNYKNVDKIKSSQKTNDGGANFVHDDFKDNVRFNNGSAIPDNKKELVEILEYWEADRLVVVANQKVVLRDSPNPYAHKRIPFVELDDYRDPHKFYGQSEASVIDPLQREINSIRNQRRDYDNLALNPVIRMVPGTLRNPNSAVMAPGNIWQVSDMNGMDVFALPQLQGTSSDIEERTARDIKMSVAIDEIGIGLLPEGSSRRSATEVVTAQSMAGKRFAVKIALLEEAVKQIGQLVFALNQQFLDQEKVIQVVGERGAQEWVKLLPEDVRGDFFIDIETGSMLPKDEIAARQEAVQLLQYITPIISPVIQTNPGIIMPVIRMVLDTFELPGKQEILDELNKALGIATEQQQAQQATAQQQQDAQTVATLSQAAQSQLQTPETLQGVRADNELAALLQGQQ